MADHALGGVKRSRARSPPRQRPSNSKQHKTEIKHHAIPEVSPPVMNLVPQCDLQLWITPNDLSFCGRLDSTALFHAIKLPEDNAQKALTLKALIDIWCSCCEWFRLPEPMSQILQFDEAEHPVLLRNRSHKEDSDSKPKVVIRKICINCFWHFMSFCSLQFMKCKKQLVHIFRDIQIRKQDFLAMVAHRFPNMHLRAEDVAFYVKRVLVAIGFVNGNKRANKSNPIADLAFDQWAKFAHKEGKTNKLWCGFRFLPHFVGTASKLARMQPIAGSCALMCNPRSLPPDPFFQPVMRKSIVMGKKPLSSRVLLCRLRVRLLRIRLCAPQVPCQITQGHPFRRSYPVMPLVSLTLLTRRYVVASFGEWIDGEDAVVFSLPLCRADRKNVLANKFEVADGFLSFDFVYRSLAKTIPSGGRQPGPVVGRVAIHPSADVADGFDVLVDFVAVNIVFASVKVPPLVSRMVLASAAGSSVSLVKFKPVKVCVYPVGSTVLPIAAVGFIYTHTVTNGQTNCSLA